MPVYTYKARTQAGEAVDGQLDAASETAVKEALVQKGLFPTQVTLGLVAEVPKAKASAPGIRLFRKKLKSKDLANFTRQFQILFNVGMPMDQTLKTLAEQAQHDGLKTALIEILKDVQSGVRLAAAFGKHPKIFDSLYTTMLELGQTGGVLDVTLKELAVILDKDDAVRSKVKSALLYPKIIMVAILGVTIGMLVFVFPPFKAFYDSYNAPLPLPTRIVMGLSDLSTTYWYFGVLILASIYGTWKLFARSKAGREILCELEYRVPVFGNMSLLSVNARFGHLTSSLYRAGLPLQNALRVVDDTMTNLSYKRDMKHLIAELESGSTLSKSMEGTRFFPPMIRQACAVGEQTGRLDEVLASTATFYDTEVNHIVSNLTTLIEPFLIFFMFGMVLLLALSVYLPIWNISRVVLH